MGRKKQPIDPKIKEILGFSPEQPDIEVFRQWKKAVTLVCKPCWELRYCPYGSLVEQFPLLPPTRASAIKHNEYLKECLRTGNMANGQPLDEMRKKAFKKDVRSFDPDDYPENIPPEIADMACNIFGHICPVVFTGEMYTETSEVRRHGRYIPFKTKIRVVRRDNYTCQHCGKHLRDDEVEFDHMIPYAKGGSSEEHNLRLTCHDCNQDKSDKIEI